MNLRRNSLPGAGAALACLALSFPMSAASADAPRIVDGSLSLDVVDEPLGTLLTDIARVAGLELHLLGDRPPRVTVRLDDVPLAEGLRTILRGRSSIILYDQARGEEPAAGVKSLWVFCDASTAASPAEKVGISGNDDLSYAVAQEAARDRLPMEVYSQPARTELGYLSRELKAATDPVTIKQTVDAIVALGDEHWVGTVATGLAASDPDVRIHTLSGIDTLGGNEAEQIFGQTLYGDRDPAVRIAAIRGLERRHSDVARLFVQAALKDKTNEVREAARSALRSW